MADSPRPTGAGAEAPAAPGRAAGEASAAGAAQAVEEEEEGGPWPWGQQDDPREDRAFRTPSPPPRPQLASLSLEAPQTPFTRALECAQWVQAVGAAQEEEVRGGWGLRGGGRGNAGSVVVEVVLVPVAQEV